MKDNFPDSNRLSTAEQPMISFKIALRFLKSGGTQTTLIVIGIAIAISIQLFVGLLIDSLQRTLVDRTLGNTPHITIVSATDVAGIRDWESVLRHLEEIHSVDSVSVSADGNAFVVDKVFKPTSVAIVDDVVTTGSTVYALAQCLKSNGIKKISVWSFARSGDHFKSNF